MMFTKISDILLAVNPFKTLPIFDRSTLEKYKDASKSSPLPPHIFAMADQAYQQMTTHDTPQSIVISGESGAGKTETTKMALKFIAELSGSTHAQAANSNLKGLEERIIQANPLIEAFGNAKTSRNDNSSRFGKLLSVYFDKSGAMTGTRVIPYLLEKSRVVGLQQGERNYHIFYQMLAGRSQLPSSLEPNLHLPDSPQKFNYLAKSGVYSATRDSHSSIGMGSDVQGLAEVLKAMKDVLELKEEEQGIVFQCLAGVLHLGNVGFETRDGHDEGAKLCEDEGGAIPLATAAALLGVEEDPIPCCRAVMSKNIGNHSVIVVPFNPETAGITRDALAKAVYSAMFDWIIKSCNARLGGVAGDVKQKKMALTVNSLEQLCINYCNEKLQHFFMSYAVSMEIEEYKQEGIPVDSSFDVVDNSSILKLLESPPTESCPSGLLPMLDEELELLKTTDQTYLSKVQKTHEKCPHLFRAKSTGWKREVEDAHQSAKVEALSDVKDCFVVQHYAGKVQYDTSGWLDKNRDRLAPGVAELLASSSHPLLAAAGEQEVNRDRQTGSPGGSMSRSAKAKMNSAKSRESLVRSRSNTVGAKLNTLGFKFRGQLGDLLDTLQNSSAHFVRCFKPNSLKVRDEFDSRMVLQQLRDTGLLGVCLIRQRGYSSRMPFDAFFKTYKILCPNAGDHKELVAELVQQGDLLEGKWASGKTKIFMRHEARNVLDAKKRVEEEKQKLEGTFKEEGEEEKEAAEQAEREEAERLAKEEEERRPKEEAERREREEAEKRAKEEERRRKEEAERRAKEEAERREREEAEKRAEEEERRRKEEAERRAKEEAERREREEAEKRAEEEERRRKEEEERRAKEEAERREREEAETRRREEEERRRKEEEERRAKEEAERREREEAARLERERLEAEKEKERQRVVEEKEKIRVEREAALQERIDRLEREAVEREEREEAERVKREEAEKVKREEEERAKREEGEKRREREEVERFERERREEEKEQERQRLEQEREKKILERESVLLKRIGRLEKDGAVRQEREEAARVAREAAEKREKEEAERVEREQAERHAREGAEREEREEAERVEREKMEEEMEKEGEYEKRREEQDHRLEKLEQDDAERVEREEKARVEQGAAEREEAGRLEREEAERQEKEKHEKVREQEQRTEEQEQRLARLEREAAEQQEMLEADKAEREEAERVKREEVERLEAETQAEEEERERQREEEEKERRLEKEALLEERVGRVEQECAESVARDEAEAEREEAKRLERERKEEEEEQERERVEQEKLVIELEALRRREAAEKARREKEKKKKSKRSFLGGGLKRIRSLSPVRCFNKKGPKYRSGSAGSDGGTPDSASTRHQPPVSEWPVVGDPRDGEHTERGKSRRGRSSTAGTCTSSVEEG